MDRMIDNIIDKYTLTINEKYYNGFKQYGDMVDIFENPTSKELKEIGNVVRFFANMKTKKIWMWDGYNAIHEDAINQGNLVPTPGFNYREYAFSGKHADIIFGGAIEKGKLVSDSWDASPTANFSMPDLAKQPKSYTKNNIEKMLDQDMSWISKYGINPKDVKRIVSSLVSYLNQEQFNGY